MTTRAIAQGFYSLLSGDATLAGLISSYEGSPSVFTFDYVPEDAELPYVQTRAENRLFKTEGLDQRLIEFGRGIECYAEANGDPLPVSDIADRIAELFAPPSALSIAGFNVIHTVVDGPVVIDTDAESYGRSVEVRVHIYKSS